MLDLESVPIQKLYVPVKTNGNYRAYCKDYLANTFRVGSKPVNNAEGLVCDNQRAIACTNHEASKTFAGKGNKCCDL